MVDSFALGKAVYLLNGIVYMLYSLYAIMNKINLSQYILIYKLNT
jgi:hypothetical protein